MQGPHPFPFFLFLCIPTDHYIIYIFSICHLRLIIKSCTWRVSATAKITIFFCSIELEILLHVHYPRKIQWIAYCWMIYKTNHIPSLSKSRSDYQKGFTNNISITSPWVHETWRAGGLVAQAWDSYIVHGYIYKYLYLSTYTIHP